MADIRQFVNSAARQFHASEEQASELVIAVNEAVTNIILHGFNNIPSGQLEVIVHRSQTTIEVTLKDNAPLFDPTTVPSPDVSVPLDKRKLGGLGIEMMRSFTDELVYTVSNDGKNTCTLKVRAR